MRTRIFICAALLSIDLALAGETNPPVAAEPVVTSVDPYRDISGAKLRKILSGLRCYGQWGIFPTNACRCQVWRDDKYGYLWILIAQTYTLARFYDGVFSIPEAQRVCVYEGSWDLRKNLIDTPGACGKLVLQTNEAKDIVFHCVVDGRDFDVPYSGAGEVSQLTFATATVTDESQIQVVFDLERAREIVDGTVASQMVEKVAIYYKWLDDGPADWLDIAGVVDKEQEIQSLISALKRSYFPPESRDPLIKPGDWCGFEFRFKCKDHRDAVLSIFVFDGYYTIVGHSNPGERYSTLVHQEDSNSSSNKSPRCFFAQNLLVGKWLEAHGLPFREGTKKKTERKDSR